MTSRWPVPLLAAGLLAAGCASSSSAPAPRQSLDDVIEFDDPAACLLSRDSAVLIDGFVRNNLDTLSDGWIRPGTVPAHLRGRFGPIEVNRNDGWLVVRTEARGSLWGLPLAAIAHEIPEGGDPGGLVFEFEAPAAAVEKAARARGFVARAGEDVAMGPPDALVHSIGLHPLDDGSGSALSCGYHS